MKKASDIFGKHMCEVLSEMCKRVNAKLEDMDFDKFQTEADRHNESGKPLFCDSYEWTEEEQDHYRDWWVDYLYNSAPARKELYGVCKKNKKYIRDKCWPWWMLTFCWRFKKEEA